MRVWLFISDGTQVAAVGAKVVLWLDPHVHRNGTAMGHELIGADCMSTEWADTGGVGCNSKHGCGYSALTVPKCQQIWAKHVEADLLSVGVAGFKLDQDDGGTVLFKDNTTFPATGGFTGSELHNVCVATCGHSAHAAQTGLLAAVALACCSCVAVICAIHIRRPLQHSTLIGPYLRSTIVLPSLILGVLYI
jgi:hypothetical protein